VRLRIPLAFVYGSESKRDDFQIQRDNIRMVKGSREAVLRKMQPISIHGQLSYDLHYRFADEPDGQMRVARVGPEAIAPGIQAGDHVRLDFLVGVVTAVNRTV
jgi:hypothetical protein